MPVELVVLRHAEAADKEAGGNDFQRELTGKGRRQAERMGRQLAHRGLHPGLVVTSPAARALQTAEIAAGELGIPADRLAHDGAVYESNVPDLLDVLRRHGAGHRRVMLVGHNPSLEALVDLLSGATGTELGKGDAAILRGAGTWSDLGQHRLALAARLEA